MAEAFIQLCRHELTSGPLIGNQGAQNPKQAFRLEIIDKFHLPEPARRVYDGLVRWHIFLQDWRGKSLRGMLTPRLYLNRVLLPFGNLSFSSHDSVSLYNDEFVALLLRPAEFSRRKRRPTLSQESTLWDPQP